MKTFLMSLAGAFLVLSSLHVPAHAQVPAAVATVTTVTSDGTLHQYVPGTSFIVTEPTGAVAYQYGPQTVYATSGGQILTAEQVQARVRVGIPVRVEYVPQGDTRVIHRVIVRDKDDDDDDDDDND